MRIIKFRAWDKEYKKMYGPGDMRVALAYPDNDIEIMQYIGLKDKNGKEIYEGDVVRVCDGGLGLHFHWVVWDKDVCGFIYQDKYGNRVRSIGNMVRTSVEVIGNIYENPSLV